MINKFRLGNENLKLVSDFSNTMWNDQFIECISENFIPETLIQSPIKLSSGVDDFKDIIKGWQEAFPKMEYKEYAFKQNKEKNIISIDWTCKTQMLGSFLGLTVNGKKFEYRGTTHFTLKDKKIVNYFANVDVDAILSKLDKNFINPLSTQSTKSRIEQILQEIYVLFEQKITHKQIIILSLSLFKLSRKDIGVLLDIKETTVREHCIRAYKKLGILHCDNFLEYLVSTNKLEIMSVYATSVLKANLHKLK